LQSHFDKISWVCNRNCYDTYAHAVHLFNVFIRIGLAWPFIMDNGR
jgi:hypothetical protein